jgi:uncharacterized membrane protein YhaH (DUF805 family)
MGLMAATRTCFRKYFVFSGRATRPEYWYFVLFCFLGSFVTAILDGVVFSTASDGPLNAIFSLATLIPLLSAGWRRMHDTGRSGLYLLNPLIASVGVLSYVGFLGGMEETLGEMATKLGGIVLIIAMFILMISPLIVLFWLVRPTQPGPNAYGPQP